MISLCVCCAVLCYASIAIVQTQIQSSQRGVLIWILLHFLLIVYECECTRVVACVSVNLTVLACSTYECALITCKIWQIVSYNELYAVCVCVLVCLLILLFMPRSAYCSTIRLLAGINLSACAQKCALICFRLPAVFCMHLLSSSASILFSLPLFLVSLFSVHTHKTLLSLDFLRFIIILLAIPLTIVGIFVLLYICSNNKPQIDFGFNERSL